MNLQKWKALLWKESMENLRLYAAVALVLLLLDLWVVVRPGIVRSALIPWLFAPVWAMTFFFGLGNSLQREWREQTVQFLFALPVPRGWTLATKLFVHYAFFLLTTVAFALLTWKLMDRYVVYVVMRELSSSGRSLEEGRELIEKLQQENRLSAYIRFAGTLGLVGLLLSGASVLYALIGNLVYRFRGLVVLLGFVVYGYGLFRFMDLWNRFVPLSVDPSDLLASGMGFAVGMGLYGLFWTVLLLGLVTWRAEV